MDDFVISNLREASNEWSSRLVSIFAPLVNEGITSIFNEAWKMCLDNNEAGKYLMTFQNLLSRVPKWNAIIVEEERKRIIERSGCNYLEDLITCVHVIQLKVLTSIRVGNKQKQIDIAIPNLDHFIHKVYIHVARKVYMNVYLFEKNISPLQIQKNGRELEVIIQECILTTIRESIPTEAIIRAYMDETVEHEEDVRIETLDNTGSEENKDGVDGLASDDTEKKESDLFPEPADEKPPAVVPAIQNIDNENVVTRLTFNDYDAVLNGLDEKETVEAPKTIERLEEISASRAIQRKLEEEAEDMEDRIKIHTDTVDLSSLGIMDMGKTDQSLSDVPLLEFEELL
jgi:hypothetical protein